MGKGSSILGAVSSSTNSRVCCMWNVDVLCGVVYGMSSLQIQERWSPHIMEASSSGKTAVEVLEPGGRKTQEPEA